MHTLKTQYNHLKDLPIASYTRARPTILIGLDNAHLLMPKERRMLDDNSPIAMRTKLGWIVFGNLKQSVAQDYIMAIQEDDEMRNVMKQDFSTEDFGDKAVENLPKKKEVKRNSIWVNGPGFLHQAEHNWPKQEPITETNEEARILAIHAEAEQFDFIEENRYSIWWKLVRHLCILKKFVDWLRNKRQFSRALTQGDREVVENTLYKKAQWEMFPSEMKDLTLNGQLTKNGPLSSLRPLLDEFGVMRSKGRLDDLSALKCQARRPIILPKKHHISHLIVKSYHEKYLHHLDEAAIGALQCKYWIIGVRAVLKNVKHQCQHCILWRARPNPPLMASLPDFRAKPHLHPFTHTGVDYFGPYEVRVHRSTEKRWGVLFTCLSSRAAHIEMAEKLDTDSFLTCFKNFQNRRGKVSYLYSDNGTNFVGAKNEIRELLSWTNKINTTMERGQAAALEVQWTFNPPAAPHFGGVWERLIGIIKTSLKHMFNSCKKPTPELLRAGFIQAEFLLNSRPLTHIPLDTIDDEVLTPFHALIGRAAEYASPFAPMVDGFNKEQWKLAQHYGQLFWNRWKKEYLPTLIKRNKWTEEVIPIKENDVVIITDDNAPAGRWLKGRIIRTYPGKDGQVRSADIQTMKGIINRPATKIAIIDVTGQRDKKDHVNEQCTATTDASEGQVMIIRSEAVVNENKTKNNGKYDQKVNNNNKIADSKKRQAANTNFSNWGKRNKLDIDKIKEMRDQHQKKHPPREAAKPVNRIKPCTWAKALLLSTTLLSIISPTTSLKIDPINKDGIIFHHEGTCLVQRGQWTTKIETNITPTEDITHINLMYKNLKDILDKVTRNVKDDTLTELTIMVEQQCKIAIQEIQAITNKRTKRSKGIFGFMKDLIFGSDDLEDKLQSIQVENNLKLHQFSSLITNIEEKTDILKTQLSRKLNGIHEGLDRITKQFNSRQAEIATKRLLETIVLVRQITESILNRYKVVQLNPISDTEKLQIIDKIEERLPNDCVILKNKLASRYEIISENNSLQIVMKSTIVNRETFEVFSITAIPRVYNRSIIEVNFPYIAVNHHEQYFYISKDLVKINESYFLTQQKTFFTEPDCIAAAILHKLPREMCKITTLKTNYSKIITLSHPNVVLYYAQNPRSILIHCKEITITPPHYAAIVYMDPECEIRTKDSITYASSTGQSRGKKIFFKSKEEIPHQTDIKPTIEIANVTYTSVSTDKLTPINHHHWFTLIITILPTLLLAVIILFVYYKRQENRSRQHEIEMNNIPQPKPRKRVPLPKPIVKHSVEEETC